MATYWNASVSTPDTTPTPPSKPAATASEDDDDHQTLNDQYNRERMQLIAAAARNKGWRKELEDYLGDVVIDATPQTDPVAWWAVSARRQCFPPPEALQTNQKRYPTLARIALDVLPVAASSVPCERLFSAAVPIDTPQRSRLGPELFEQLQLLKAEWRRTLVDLVKEGQDEEEEVELVPFQALLQLDQEMKNWDLETGGWGDLIDDDIEIVDEGLTAMPR